MSTDTTFDNDPSQVGQSSVEAADSGEANQKANGFNVWNAMLMLSMICIILACLMLVFELRTFSDFPFSYPWNTASAETQ